MRKIFVVLTLVAGAIFVDPGVANAAPPIRESGIHTSLNLFDSDCVPDGDGQLCTSVYFDANQNTSTNTTQVCTSTDTYRITDETFELISGEQGCTETTGALTLSTGFNAALAPTQITLTSFTCNSSDCTNTGSRIVTVSASGTATASTSKSSGKSTFTEQGCKFRSTYTSVQAPVTGSIVIDGTTIAGEGSTAETNYKISSTCR